MLERGTLVRPRLRRSPVLAAAFAILLAGLAATPSPARGPDFVADVAEGLQDAVVNISTTQTLKGSAEAAPDGPGPKARLSRSSSTISSTMRAATVSPAR